MGRGRRAQSPEVKALKGNPGKRKLALSNIGKRSLPQQSVPPPPAFLTQEAEREAFRAAFETLPANVARASDVNAMARWAAWLNVWVVCKLQLDGKRHWYTTTSAHSPEIHREHPLAKRMDKAEAHLVTLEDRLCLNIVARNNVIHRLFNMPGAHPGGMFTEEELPMSEKPETEIDVPDQAPVSPLGWMQQAGKPN